MGVAPDTAVEFDAEKNQALLDSLLEDSPVELAEEVSGLLGRNVTFSDMKASFMTESEILQDGPTKRVVAEMSLGSGENKIGLGYFLSPVKGAIELGGVLIMLPESEIEKSVKEEDFYEDLQDAYGEIANIVSGFYNRVFETEYTPAKTRVIRKNVSEVNTLTDDDVLQKQMYYCYSLSVMLGEKSLGRFQMSFPAVALKLFAEEVETTVSEEGGNDAVEKEITFPLGESLEKHQQKIDAILEECSNRCQQEVSNLISADVVLGDIENLVVNKEDFFSREVKGKQILSFMETKGEDASGESFIIVGMKAAIHMGGVLVMLPPPELESAVKDEEYGEDVADAYGEIANIITGAYTSTFEQLYKKQLHFVRKDIIEVSPLTVETDSDTPFADGNYYLSRMSLQVEGKDLGRLNMLFPLDVLNLQGLVYEEPTKEEEVKESDAAEEKKEWGEGAAREEEVVEDVIEEVFDILLIGDDEASAGMITQCFTARGFSAKTISFKDDVMSFLGDQVRAVYLVMREVNEQAFGMVIKLSTSSSLPIIAAAPAWTRSKVIKAVKYGVQDILMTPATDDEIAENIKKNVQ